MHKSSSGFWFYPVCAVFVGSACIFVADDDSYDDDSYDSYGRDDEYSGGGPDGPYGTPTDSAATAAMTTGPVAPEPGTSEGVADTGSSGDTLGRADTGEEDSTSAPGESTGGGAGTCGWGVTGQDLVSEGYICGGTGEDPSGDFSITCPEGLVEGAECGSLTGIGCCDAEGSVWYCADPAGPDPAIVLVETCA